MNDILEYLSEYEIRGKIDPYGPPGEEDEKMYSGILFNKISKSMTLWQKVYEEIGKDGQYLHKIMATMRDDNSIDFSLLGLSDSSIYKIKARLTAKGMVKRLKIGEGNMKRYLNPLLQTCGRRISKGLIYSFSEINEELGYKWGGIMYKNI